MDAFEYIYIYIFKKKSIPLKCMEKIFFYLADLKSIWGLAFHPIEFIIRNQQGTEEL